MRPSIGILVVVSFIWLAVAFFLDRYLLAPVCSACSDLVSIKLQVELPALKMNLPNIGLLVLLGLPLFVSALIYTPWKSPLEKSKWTQAIRKWCQPIIWALVALVLIILGQGLYLLISSILPEGVRNFAEAFKMTATIYIKHFDFLELEGSVTALVGFIGGCYLFLEKGIRGIWNIGQ